MEYVTPKDKATEWGITQRRVEILCGDGRIPGAYRLGRVWAIPKDARKPLVNTPPPDGHLNRPSQTP